MADEPKRVPAAQEALRRSMEDVGGAVSPMSPVSSGMLPIEERAEVARAGTGTITQSLTDMRIISAQIEERLLGGGSATSEGALSVQDSLRVHVAWLARLLTRL